MVNRKTKTNVVVASGDVLYRLGIKTILSVIGLDIELIETDDSVALDYLMRKEENQFFIISQDVVSLSSGNFIKNSISRSTNKKIMVIGEPFVCVSDQVSFLYGITEQKKIVEHFTEFFAEAALLEKQDNNVLTGREIDILRHVALGMANKEIADKLFISTNTVITHRKNITEKLGIKTIPGLTVYAIMNNIINTEEVTF